MHLTRGRTVSLLIAVLLLVSSVSVEPSGLPHRSDAETTFRNVVYLTIALALIWFPEQIAAAGSYVARGNGPQATPARFVYFAGWFLLIVPPVLMLVVNR
jgi:heme/copper-type cytochrome/quinol oxidase subunit 3